MNDVGNDETTCCDVGVTEPSATEWRACNRLLKDGDPAAILGFIRQVTDRFEVTDLGQLTERSHFSPFDQAAVSLVSPMART